MLFLTFSQGAVWFILVRNENDFNRFVSGEGGWRFSNLHCGFKSSMFRQYRLWWISFALVTLLGC
ncbi:hypothetical protein BVH06_14340 [Pseudomonas sp. PA27(2017)]|nr:hypothetical protein BVH06_14340 [Pseudomonas sp. PA27(2017)]